MANKDTVEKFFDALNRHDLDTAMGVWAPDAEIHDPGAPEAIKGTDAIRQNLNSWLQAFPDIKLDTVGPVLSEGNNAGFQVRISGTHLGDLVGPQGTVPPTNKVIQFAGMGFWTLNSQGLIAEESRYYDTAGLMSQLGLVSWRVVLEVGPARRDGGATSTRDLP